MAEYEPIDEGVQVNGRTVLTIVEAMADLNESFREEALEILADNGIEDPEPGQWYSQEDWLEAFREIDDRLGRMTLWNIGEHIPDNARWPDHVDTPAEGLDSIDDAYHLNHQGGDIGHYDFTRTGEGEGRMVCTNPYPCDFDKGIIKGVVNRFGDEDASVYIDEKEDACRQDGDDRCVYILQW